MNKLTNCKIARHMIIIWCLVFDYDGCQFRKFIELAFAYARSPPYERLSPVLLCLATWKREKLEAAFSLLLQGKY